MEYKVKLSKLNATGTARDAVKLDIVLEQQLSDLMEYFLTVDAFGKDMILRIAKKISKL